MIMAVTVLIMRMTAGKVTDRHGEGIFAYSCNIAMFAAFLLLGLFPNTVTYLLAAVLSGFGFGWTGGLHCSPWRWRLHHPKSAAVQIPPSSARMISASALAARLQGG